MATIVQGLIYPVWYTIRGKEPSKGYHEASREERSSVVVNPKNAFLGSLLAAAVAAAEYFAFKALMAQMPNTPTAVAVGFLFYQSMGSLIGYQPTDAAISAWCAEKVIRVCMKGAPSRYLYDLVAPIMTNTGLALLAAAFFCHKFACIDEIKTSFVDRMNKQMNIPAFEGRHYAFDTVLKIRAWWYRGGSKT